MVSLKQDFISLYQCINDYLKVGPPVAVTLRRGLVAEVCDPVVVRAVGAGLEGELLLVVLADHHHAAQLVPGAGGGDTGWGHLVQTRGEAPGPHRLVAPPSDQDLNVTWDISLLHRLP